MFRALILLFLGFLALFAATSPVRAADDAKHIAASLVAEQPQIAPGETVTLAIVMRPDAGWHGYWQNPGDAGIGMSAKWTLPAGLSAGPLRYPTPGRLTVQGIMNYVYERDYAVLVDITADPSVTRGVPLAVSARLSWLACTDTVCVPEDGTVATRLTGSIVAAKPMRDTRFAAYRQALPATLDQTGRWERHDGKFRLEIPFPAGAPLPDPYFFPATNGVLDYGAPQRFFRSGNRLIVETKARAGAVGAVSGILQVAGGDGLWINANPGAVATVGLEPVVAASSADEESDLLLILAAAIAGGLLLNIMPCVFPILGLKALSLAKAGGSERAARREAMFYTLGSVVTCVALGAALLTLRASGEEVGWAFQLQDPRIVTLLLLLMVAIAASLAGLFELPALNIGATEHDGRSAFATGALAAFVATPCTGPFMAAALGAALFLPAAQALLLFAGLGFGLALPFLALGFIPALRHRLPKPGPWLAMFRRIMAVPMALTALALAWLLWRMAGIPALGAALAIAAALVAFVVVIGQRQRAGLAAFNPALVVLVGALCVAGALVPAAVAIDPPASGDSDGQLASEPFTAARLAELRRENRPVFAYFTADWCITCKVNEAAAIDRAATQTAFARANIAALRGDFTRRDPEIARFLARNGRSGVPLYLYYPPGGKPQILPQLLTPDMLIALAR